MEFSVQIEKKMIRIHDFGDPYTHAIVFDELENSILYKYR